MYVLSRNNDVAKKTLQPLFSSFLRCELKLIGITKEKGFGANRFSGIRHHQFILKFHN
jgi:hypothetical protein